MMWSCFSAKRKPSTSNETSHLLTSTSEKHSDLCTTHLPHYDDGGVEANGGGDDEGAPGSNMGNNRKKRGGRSVDRAAAISYIALPDSSMIYDEL